MTIEYVSMMYERKVMTKSEVRRVLKGRQSLVTVAGTETQLYVSNKEIIYLFDAYGGDLAYNIDGNLVHWHANAWDNFDMVGRMV